jgi:ferredoxin
MPVNSIKEFFFPRHEVLYEYERDGKKVTLRDVEPFDDRQVIFGARPCDAAALPVLDHIFAWDFDDRFFQSRRENTTVVVLACRESDQHCFCTSVGFAPDSTEGADAMLLDVGDGEFELRTFSEKGEALFEKAKTEESEKTGKTAEPPEKRFDPASLREALQSNYDDPIWNETSLRCVGCGACTYICPTCHCFDIVDEGTIHQGRRVKNWDSCQFGLFTLHASGHNPRTVQSQRQRQRIQHKFNIYPEKFGVMLCTGCGNCTRVCSASLGVQPVLQKLQQKAT